MHFHEYCFDQLKKQGGRVLFLPFLRMEKKMINFESIKFDKVVLDCLDPDSLADFYVKLLGWKKGYMTDDFVIIGSISSNVDIGFQKNTNYIPPTWPEKDNEQQQMLHLDFSVENTEEMKLLVHHAISCGAKKAEYQFSELWTVMIDPEGHPFCIEPRT